MGTRSGLNSLRAQDRAMVEDKNDGERASIPNPNMVDAIAKDWARHRRYRVAIRSRVLFMAATANGLDSSRALARAAEASTLEDEAAPAHHRPMEDEIVADWVQALIPSHAILRNVQV